MLIQKCVPSCVKKHIAEAGSELSVLSVNRFFQCYSKEAVVNSKQ